MKETGRASQYIGDGVEVETVEFDDGSREVRCWYEFHLEDGPDGTPAFTAYHPDGTLRLIEHRFNGSLHSPKADTPAVQRFLPNGALAFAGYYSMGKRLRASGDPLGLADWLAGEVAFGVPAFRSDGRRTRHPAGSPNAGRFALKLHEPPRITREGDQQITSAEVEGSLLVERRTNDQLHDGPDGEPAQVQYGTDGRVISIAHHLYGFLTDSLDGEPAVSAFYPDGTLRATRRYRMFARRPEAATVAGKKVVSKLHDSEDGEPAVAHYQPDGTPLFVSHFAQGRYGNAIPDRPSRIGWHVDGSGAISSKEYVDTRVGAPIDPSLDIACTALLACSPTYAVHLVGYAPDGEVLWGTGDTDLGDFS